MGCRGMGAARIVMKIVEIPESNLVGELNDGNAVFNAMMVPERLTSAAGPIGMGRAAIEIAVRYADKREAFGRAIKKFEAISFKVADCTTELDAARGLVYRAAKKADTGEWSRKEVSQAKVFATEAGFTAVHEAMQILGGIGYTDVYPIERLYRDARLATIWTGSNEVQRLIIQNEVFREILSEDRSLKREVELDTPGGLLDSTEVIVQEIMNANVPVVVYVSPRGSMAASAGTFITLSAHIAAMTPGTTIGAAHPVAGGGQEIPEDQMKKITEFSAKWMKTIAEDRNRNAEEAQLAVTESKSFTDVDALE